MTFSCPGRTLSLDYNYYGCAQLVAILIILTDFVLTSKWTYSDFLQQSVELFVSVSRYGAVREERGEERGVTYQDTVLPLLKTGQLRDQL